MPSANDLVLFDLLISFGSFTKAAEAAGISVPAFSKRISKLESELNTQLVYRSTRTVSLTEAGRLLVEHAKSIHDHLDHALAELSGFSNEPKGNITISVPTISGEILLAEAVAKFCQLYTKTEVTMRMENHYVDLIKEGVDIAVRTGYLEDSTLKAKLLIQSDWVICACPSYLQRNGRPNQPHDLVSHNCLIYSLQDGGAHNWLFKDHKQEYLIKVSGTFKSNNGTSLKKAALAGFGVIYVPKCLVHSEIASGALEQLFKSESAKRQGVYAVTPYSKVQSIGVQSMIDQFYNAYQSVSHWFLN